MPVRNVHVRDHQRHAPHGQMMIDVDDYDRRQEVGSGPPPGAADLGPRDEFRDSREQQVVEVQAAARARGQMTDEDDYRLERLEDDLIGDHNAERLWARQDQVEREHWLGPISGVSDRTHALESYTELPVAVRKRLIETQPYVRYEKSKTAELAPLKPGEKYHIVQLRDGHVIYDLYRTEDPEEALRVLRAHQAVTDKIRSHDSKRERDTVEVVTGHKKADVVQKVLDRGKLDYMVTGDTYQHRQHLQFLRLSYDHNRGCYRGKMLPSVAEDLKKDGLSVTPDKEFTDEERQSSKVARAERKAARYDQYAESARSRGETHLEAAHERGERIPMGQPILVGHHSERGHRSDLDKVDRSYEKGFSELKKAETYERRARNLRATGSHRKGDAAAARDAERNAARAYVSPGSRVFCPIYGSGTVVKVHQKTAKVAYDRGFTNNTDLSLLRVPES